MVISFGEILLDVFENSSTKESHVFVGGAPFNVAYQIKKMGNEVLFVGNIGDDSNGKIIRRFFENNHLDNRGLTIHKNKKTTIAKVTLKNSERSFTFEKENLDFKDDTLDFISKGDIVHVGSMMLSNEKGRNFARQIISYGKAQKKILSFDINYRKDFFKSKEEAKEIYEDFYPLFDIVKFSREELSLFTEENDIEKAVVSLKKGPKLLLVTDGKYGSYAYCHNRVYASKGIKVNAIDTTGAGDAFLGTFLSNVDSLGLEEMTFIPSLLESTLKFSNIAGALATTKKGAISSLPSYKEVNAVLEKQTLKK